MSVYKMSTVPPSTPVKGGGWTVPKNLVRMTFSANAFHVAFRAFRCLTISVFFAGVTTLRTCHLPVLIRVWVSQGKAGSEAEEEEEGVEHQAFIKK